MDSLPGALTLSQALTPTDVPPATPQLFSPPSYRRPAWCPANCVIFLRRARIPICNFTAEIRGRAFKAALAKAFPLGWYSLKPGAMNSVKELSLCYLGVRCLIMACPVQGWEKAHILNLSTNIAKSKTHSCPFSQQFDDG